ncbi:MAG: dihydropteroate synthase [Candidatus Eisenbacteria bacterium]|nr:dihydropteroate synthase [Candidatus Eisenbacteria bacterium]
MIWRCCDVSYDLSERVLVMGILNVTPDSLSDGARWLDPAAAAARAHELLAQGADIIDLGAESTRPGSAAVPADEQWRRLEPLLERLAAERPDAVVSCDTRDAVVAERALAAGARIVNDVSALSDPRMAAVCAAAGAGLVLMHMRGTPETMQADTHYDDVVGEVSTHLAERTARARAAGVVGEAIAWDPGIGFGKSAEGSLELLARGIGPLRSASGRPVLVGASRKSFLARLTGGVGPSADRVPESLAAATIAVLEGASILRVHDVAETVKAAKVAVATRDVQRRNPTRA